MRSSWCGSAKLSGDRERIRKDKGGMGRTMKGEVLIAEEELQGLCDEHVAGSIALDKKIPSASL